MRGASEKGTVRRDREIPPYGKITTVAVGMLLACREDSVPTLQGTPGSDTSSSSGAPESSSSSSEGSTSSSSSTGEPAIVCRESERFCDDACVDVLANPEHCGTCEEICNEREECFEGACVLACASTERRCDGECVDPATDLRHCGACNAPCPTDARCEEGRCIAICPEPLVACGLECANFENDERHCGGCGKPCDASIHCVWQQCVDAQVNHVLMTGQSLSVGQAAGVVSATQPWSNLMFNTGVRAGGNGLQSFVPLVEQSNGVYGETIASGLANRIALLTALADPNGIASVQLVSTHGVGSATYAELRRDTQPYWNGLAQALAGWNLSIAQGTTYAVRAVAVLHGEADHVVGNEVYTADLIEWQADYERDLRELLGQPYPIPLFFCQMSSFTHYGSATSTIPAQQLEATRERPDRIFLVGPKYFLRYVSDGVHLTASSQRRLGEYYARVYERVLLDGEPWRPLMPIEVELESDAIDVRFHVPTPPLVLDTVAVTDPGHYGFEYWDDSETPPTITAVAITAEDTVRITLSEAPTALERRIRYAYTGLPNADAGPDTGPRGNLRDSDPLLGTNGIPLHNWSVHFDEPVP